MIRCRTMRLTSSATPRRSNNGRLRGSSDSPIWKRGNRSFSRTTTCLRFCASSPAMVDPAGPPPMTRTSHSRRSSISEFVTAPLTTGSPAIGMITRGTSGHTEPATNTRRDGACRVKLGCEVGLDGKLRPCRARYNSRNPRDLLPPLVALHDTPPAVLEALARRVVYVSS